MAKKHSITDAIQALKKGVSPATEKEKLISGKEVTIALRSKEAPKSLENLKKSTKPNRGNKENWGGAREGSGRQPGGTESQRRLRKQMTNEHFGEQVDIQVKDPKTGKIHTVKKSRILVQLERLYLAGYNSGKLNADAIDKWLNRALGKAPQPIIGDEEEDPVQVDHGMERILGKAYGDSGQE